MGITNGMYKYEHNKGFMMKGDEGEKYEGKFITEVDLGPCNSLFDLCTELFVRLQGTGYGWKF